MNLIVLLILAACLVKAEVDVLELIGDEVVDSIKTGFKLADKDNDEKLSPKEFKWYLTRGGQQEVPKQELKEMFKQGDHNKDKTIDFEEMLNLEFAEEMPYLIQFAKVIERIDENQNKEVDMLEIALFYAGQEEMLAKVKDELKGVKLPAKYPQIGPILINFVDLEEGLEEQEEEDDMFGEEESEVSEGSCGAQTSSEGQCSIPESGEMKKETSVDM